MLNFKISLVILDYNPQRRYTDSKVSFNKTNIRYARWLLPIQQPANVYFTSLSTSFMQNTCVHLGPLINDILYANTLRCNHMSNRAVCQAHKQQDEDWSKPFSQDLGMLNSNNFSLCSGCMNTIYPSHLLFILRVRWSWVSWYLGHKWPTVISCRWYIRKTKLFGWMRIGRGNWLIQEKICNRATLSTINLTWTNLGLNLGYCNEKLQPSSYRSHSQCFWDSLSHFRARIRIYLHSVLFSQN
jgi:hypothetical protein